LATGGRGGPLLGVIAGPRRNGAIAPQRNVVAASVAGRDERDVAATVGAATCVQDAAVLSRSSRGVALPPRRRL